MYLPCRSAACPARLARSIAVLAGPHGRGAVSPHGRNVLIAIGQRAAGESPRRP